ncbi:MAG: hypothetical protein ACRECJ_01900 [Limisphaerales bacterium]
MSAVKYREADKSDVSAMAKIRATEWETEGFWKARISGYMERKHHP